MTTTEAKLEQVFVHSRDLACRYVVVKSGETLSFSVKPQRNSIFFGVYKQSMSRRLSGATGSARAGRLQTTGSASVAMSFAERMQQAQLEPVLESVKLIGGRVHNSSIDIRADGTYALVFDNTFSKQKTKLISYTLNVHSSANGKSEDVSKALLDDEELEPQVKEEKLTGVLLKRRRKKLQGWARRWFVLDFESHTLNYYLNSSSTILRGAISLKVAVFSANKESLEINIDSGEIWNLRAQSEGAFSMWCQALLASRENTKSITKHKTADLSHSQETMTKDQLKDMSQVKLMTRLDTILAELGTVKRDLHDSILSMPTNTSEVIDDRSAQTSPAKLRVTDQSRIDSSNLTVPKKNFWSKKRPSELAAMAPSTVETLKSATGSASARSHLVEVESQMQKILQNFADILKEHRLPPNPLEIDHIRQVDKGNGRPSIDTARSDEDDIWADAVSVFEESGFLMAHHDPGSVIEDISDASSDEESFSDLHAFDEAGISTQADTTKDLFQKSLYPLTQLSAGTISRRSQVPEILDQPPSTLKLMTSKVGSDVSSMSAPAGSNEPLGLLQKAAEDLEYSSLLDDAVCASTTEGIRILTIAAFAVSSFACMRHKERSKRKPFNPMLGETFELVRDDKGYRFIAEKVQHRPITGIAASAESSSWTFHQYQATTQKFYGKSMLLTTEGCTTIVLKTGDIYVWEKPELYLKGITWGERFIEPTGEMVIRNIVTGETAIVKFLPSKGWGAGRSEEIQVDAYDSSGAKLAKHMTGNWTQSLYIDKTLVWSVGSLVDDPSLRCGFTTFAAQLNEITAIEQGHLPPSDSRLRPDVRAREQGRLEDAERHKTRVEEGQRKRRADMEAAGQSFEPLFFKASVDGKRWDVKRDEQSYWALREKSFQGIDVIDLFSME